MDPTSLGDREIGGFKQFGGAQLPPPSACTQPISTRIQSWRLSGSERGAVLVVDTKAMQRRPPPDAIVECGGIAGSPLGRVESLSQPRPDVPTLLERPPRELGRGNRGPDPVPVSQTGQVRLRRLTRLTIPSAAGFAGPNPTYVTISGKSRVSLSGPLRSIPAESGISASLSALFRCSGRPCAAADAKASPPPA